VKRHSKILALFQLTEAIPEIYGVNTVFYEGITCILSPARYRVKFKSPVIPTNKTYRSFKDAARV